MNRINLDKYYLKKNRHIKKTKKYAAFQPKIIILILIVKNNYISYKFTVLNWKRYFIQDLEHIEATNTFFT